MTKHFLLSVAGFFLMMLPAHAQSHTLRVRVYNQLYNTVAIGSVRGDRFILSDSIMTSNIMHDGVPLKLIAWSFPPEAQPGMYRIVLGQTTYARVMNEAPQQLDFIFNGEDIRLQTDFKAPADSLKVISSEENQAWFSFLKKELEYSQQIEALEMEVDFYRDKQSGFNADSLTGERKELEKKLAGAANSYNLLQMERETFVANAASENSHLFAARLIKTFREPFRDGYLLAEERNASWQKEYFRFIDFSDEALINTPVISDKIFDYLVTWNRREYNTAQREEAYIRAVDAVMAAVEEGTGKAGPVYEFVLDYLVDGFEGLNMNNVLAWILDNYAGTLCTTEEKTTLVRKLEAQKMGAGTVVPDFTIDDLHGQPVTFSQASKKRNLIVFWASWCPHCSSLLPEIKALFSGKSDLEVFAVSLDSSKADWQQAVSDAGVEHFRNLSDLKEWDGKAAEDYNIYATPTMFLVDSNRKIIARPATLEELAKMLSGN